MGSERKMYLLASLAFYSLYSLAAAAQLKLMTAPNILRVETYENIFVECQGCTEGDVAVTIRVWNFPSKTTQLNERTSVTLNKGNHFQEFAKIKISSHVFTADDHRNKYVYLQAQFGNEVLDKVVLVSFQSGYIFIQTDKTLYTPDSRVKFRLFGVTPQVLPLDEQSTPIDIEIMTPEGMTLSLPNSPFSLISGYYDGAYQLSKLASSGVYKVVAKFLSNPQYVYSAEFEVKEYVLPNFEVKLKSPEAYFRVDREALIINIEANYLFNEKVEGTATVVFGIMHDGQKKPFPNSVKMVDISEGVGEVKLTKADIRPLIITNLIGGSIFVHASVQTEDGAEMVHAELRNIKIVSSPYAIYFRRTPKYFKPGMDFDVVIETLRPDGSPAKQVQVVLEPGMVTGTTEENGMARLSINTNPTLKELVIKATTTNHEGPKATSTMTVLSYNSPSESYIHIGIGKAEVKVGENLKVNFNYNKRDVVDDITYLVLSKGQLVKYGRYKVTTEVVVSRPIDITKDMIPSFRIIAYYHTPSNEVVADSVWVDVQDTCMGSLNLEIGNPDEQIQPKDNIYLKITGDPGATVALVAVDKGVFLLNNKLRLTQQKIWDEMEKQDTGCTPGGGRNNMGVFYDAGLVFSSTASPGTPSRQELTCPSPSRRKRSSSLQNIQTSLVSQYTEKILRDCCLDGMKKTLLSYTCEKRSQYIIDGAACVQAFLRCCKEMETLDAEEREDKLVLARSEETDDDYNPDEIISRSNFPESWHWTSVKLPVCNETTCTTKTNEFPMKDTITTWEFIGISFSRENSICVAKPLSVVARKDFFVKLHLPYSVVRGEQVQIKAVVYNYRSQASTVRVDLKENDKLCSAASRRGFYRQEIRIPSRSTRSVPFVIIPLGLGLLDIEVQAAVKGRDSDIRDGIKKKLFVVSEGKLMNKVVHCSLDPTRKGGRDEATINSRVSTQDLVPGAPTSTMVFVTGKNQLGSLMSDVIAGKSLSNMILLPSGCGEQNMFGMTMSVITTIYLDKTDQWQQVGVERRYTALHYIQTGYNNELNFRKPDGSFAVYQSRPGSTWLTAFVAKVFAMAHKLAAVKEEIVCDALTFLMNQQQDNGRFRDIGTILSQYMIGDLRGKDSDASMTAFCLMAMQEAGRLCPRLVTLQSSIDKAIGYLEGRLPAITNAYAVTITSCALASENKLDRQILKRFMSADKTHWPVDNSEMFTIEATAYGLLALVKVKALDEAKPVVKWFQQYEDYLGGYRSTQVTIMVYQAIAEYWSSVTDESYDMNINLKLPGRSGVTQLYITRENYMSTKSDELDLINEDVKVVATGAGEATLKVVSFYYAQLKQKDSNCKKFNLSVTFTQDENEETIFTLSIKVMYLDPEHDATMAILDIALLTGFEPDKNDLDSLAKGPSRVIQGYETNTEGSSEDKDQKRNRGTLIIYLDKISHTEEEEITFRLHQKVLGNRLQPAAVTIYEYYDLHNQNDTNCVRFYHPIRPSGELLMLCRHGECTCAEEECTKQKREKVDNDDRIAQSCLSTQDSKTDYVFKVKVVNITEEMSTDIYTMQVVQVIKDGTDRGALGRHREFLSYKHCKWVLDLVPGKTYLIMGADKDIRIDPHTRTHQYVLGERTWIEYWPTDEECQSQEHADVCKGIAELKYKYDNFLCRQ